MSNQLIKGKLSEDGMATRYDYIHKIPSAAADRAKKFPPVAGANKIILDFLLARSGKLLEIGCGRGELIIQAPNNFEEKVGVDFSSVFLSDALDFAERYNLANSISWVLHDINNKFPFDNEYFDVIISVACIEHAFDVYHIFHEINRCLADNGYFYFVVPNIAYIKHRIRLLFGIQPVTASEMNLWWRDYWDGTHIHYFTFSSLKMLCDQTGFDVVDLTGSGRYRWLRKLYPPLLCGDLIITARKKKG